MPVFYSYARVSSAIEAVRLAFGIARSINVRRLGEGYNNLALETSDGLVFLVGKNPFAVSARAFELELLPRLAEQVPLPIPVPSWSVESAPGLPFGAMAYPRLHGERADDSRPQPSEVARQIGHFLAALHSFPATEAQACGVPNLSAFLEDVSSLRQSVDDHLSWALTAAEKAHMDAWWETFFEHAPVVPRRVLIHGDWADNFLLHEGRISGVIDFEDATLGDPAHDFATLRHYGVQFMEAALEHYRESGGLLDQGFHDRLNLYWQLRSGSLFSLRAALREADEVLQGHALGNLRRSAIFQGG